MTVPTLKIATFIAEIVSDATCEMMTFGVTIIGATILATETGIANKMNAIARTIVIGAIRETTDQTQRSHSSRKTLRLI